MNNIDSNFNQKGSAKKIKRIGIDARFYGPIGKGLGRYTKDEVDNILKIDKENEYVIFLSKDNIKDFKTDNPRVKIVLANVRWYTLAEQILLPFFIWREKIDLMHFPHFNVPLLCFKKYIVTIHDLILTKFPTQRATTLHPIFYKIKNFAYKVVIKNAIKKSKMIIAVSEFTKSDIVKQFKVNPDKIKVTYEGVAQTFLSVDNYDVKKLKLCYNIHSPFMLYVGNAYPHKNLEKLIIVFFKISKKINNLRLVLVGKEDYFYKRLKEFAKNYSNKIIFPGFVPDKDLYFLYKNALAYIFPSLYEGFGLPPLEAMSQGCVVISSNKASMPEILGEAAIYFNPEDEIDMQDKLEEIIENKYKREELIKKGYEQLKKYSWEVCAKKTLEIYKLVISNQ